jgi:hypothetical protein
VAAAGIATARVDAIKGVAATPAVSATELAVARESIRMTAPIACAGTTTVTADTVPTTGAAAIATDAIPTTGATAVTTDTIASTTVTTAITTTITTLAATEFIA